MTELKHLKEFQKILTNYRISEASQQILEQTELVVLVAPTATGRNTIIRELLKTGGYHFIVSDTTRAPRINDGVPEQNGVEYWFRGEEEVLEDLKAGMFLEAAIVHRRSIYGISMRELETARSQDKIAITDIEIFGADNIKRAKKDAATIFVLPPDFNEWQRRIHGRGEMSPEEYVNRLESAQKEFTAALERDYYQFVINDTIAHAAAQIESIIHAQKIDAESQQQGRSLAEQLLKQTQVALNNKKTN